MCQVAANILHINYHVVGDNYFLDNYLISLTLQAPHNRNVKRSVVCWTQMCPKEVEKNKTILTFCTLFLSFINAIYLLWPLYLKQFNLLHLEFRFMWDMSIILCIGSYGMGFSVWKSFVRLMMKVLLLL